ncbi:MAG: type II secretion system F family protein [Dehalobacter sp.]|nr:type II secretion system F family protein [Dehalobacter sp.]
MESILIFSGFCLIFFLVLAILSRKQPSLSQSRIMRSLGRSSVPVENEENQKEKSKKDKGKKDKNKQEKSENSFFRRLIIAFSKNSKETDPKDTELIAAGLKGWSSAEWKALRFILGLCFAIAAAALSFILSFPILTKIEFPLFCFVIGNIAPNFWLKSKIKQRKGEILRTLPDILDLVMVSVEAGLGFDAAMMKVVEKQKGILAEEFNLVLQEIKIGKPRREALRDMAKKNDVEDLSNVIASLVQADQLGISMGNVLRNQSAQIRLRRKQRIQEAAQKAPVKMMIPLVFFVFPSLFIVILGPAIINIMDILGK